MATIIDGKKLAAAFRQKTAQEVQQLKAKGIQPGLAFILVGDNPASQIYVNNKKKACDEVGITNFLEKLPGDISQTGLLKKIEALNEDPRVHGILVQLPLPKHLDTNAILNRIHPKKDVDGLHPNNLGKLYLNLPGLKPCTPQAVIAMVESTGTDIKGKDACVVGRSSIVGRPAASLLVQKDATVTLCHSQTKNLAEKIGAADIVVAAIGKPEFVKGDWIKKGAVVIDVGINRLPNGKIVGDVDFESAQKKADFITPVPGGVGPMTIAMLLKNTLEACKNA
ncbi:MAG: bifunctional 5,10-methylene-tetrahydrofolate dehydrogenase/5,10-methylene-tetrahydrofolate cyclohydrolase [Deltaproteobacteria bacterium RIFCSPLOWO2_01_44_7]|nr:MAG: bifunctional 5,10-methylene-tetrahydrofolate dehydrogenase/5,10-methylene-tetrahydrofolate cyclohydrolase [Deltaproteobacteria bacterium RIFCSPHIGHO2_01_FULL_43_49]OGQ16470.1 MAG: bifunctional 5,10-methylene-tetrahydrofolate dehydrogenase/5,10-methylene-tetrahydrofolate cyclohydrolase [Deltaproteobacteria bacterium RIFCSPHIGHO2_02_FULL_44_53]OGQ27702.1 MAG: bifunctional 5,10-methylene-tetrahydrofolate dehydrogenase/5,10-methylene-tetrahydrofolate cyclohydrolase [Deltaproteobacteria bacter